jgi:hypothetical protein
MSDLVLIAFVACAICLMTCGVCNFLWARARDEAGDDRVDLGLESEPRQRFAANTRYFGALWASSGDRAGETYRQLARWSLIAAAVMAIVFVALGVAAVS